MASTKILWTCAAMAVVFITAPTASAQTELLHDHLWVGGTGSQLWQLDTNWDPTPFPNDPARVDSSETAIAPVVGANLSVNLTGNLSVDVGATNVTVAALAMGGSRQVSPAAAADWFSRTSS
jgi:hypothetical protein